MWKCENVRCLNVLLLLFSLFFCVTDQRCRIWSNSHSANNNEISCAVEMVILSVERVACHSTTSISPLRDHFLRARCSEHMLIYFSVFHFSSSQIRMIFIFLFFFLLIWSPILFALHLRVVFFGIACALLALSASDKKRNESYFALASSFHRCDNWHTDSPFPLLHDWQATDIALFTGRKWWEAHGSNSEVCTVHILTDCLPDRQKDRQRESDGEGRLNWQRYKQSKSTMKDTFAFMPVTWK